MNTHVNLPSPPPSPPPDEDYMFDEFKTKNHSHHSNLNREVLHAKQPSPQITEEKAFFAIVTLADSVFQRINRNREITKDDLNMSVRIIA